MKACLPTLSVLTLVRTARSSGDSADTGKERPGRAIARAQASSSTTIISVWVIFRSWSCSCSFRYSTALSLK